MFLHCTHVLSYCTMYIVQCTMHIQCIYTYLLYFYKGVQLKLYVLITIFSEIISRYLTTVWISIQHNHIFISIYLLSI